MYGVISLFKHPFYGLREKKQKKNYKLKKTSMFWFIATLAPEVDNKVWGCF